MKALLDQGGMSLRRRLISRPIYHGGNLTKTITITEDQLWEIDRAARYAQCYLRKLRQWKEGKIELAVEGLRSAVLSQ